MGFQAAWVVKPVFLSLLESWLMFHVAYVHKRREKKPKVLTKAGTIAVFLPLCTKCGRHPDATRANPRLKTLPLQSPMVGMVYCCFHCFRCSVGMWWMWKRKGLWRKKPPKMQLRWGWRAGILREMLEGRFVLRQQQPPHERSLILKAAKWTVVERKERRCL